MIQGAQDEIFVNRDGLLKSANEEFVDTELDPRVTLVVNYHGEGIIIIESFSLYMYAAVYRFEVRLECCIYCVEDGLLSFPQLQFHVFL